MAEWLKAAVLKTFQSHSGKLYKIKLNLLSANNLQPFSISPDFPQFHCFVTAL
jgi:hypothetical protein